ncbi:MAG: hypothetical protein ACE37K_22720 [Planctomycetota bacterium]
MDPARARRRDLTGWLEDLLPLLDAGAKGEAVDAPLRARLDWLFQPPVYLAYYVPEGVALAVDETADGKTFAARFVSR